MNDGVTPEELQKADKLSNADSGKDAFYRLCCDFLEVVNRKNFYSN